MKPRVLFSIMLLAACADDPEPSWKVNRLRPIGARVEVATDPSRASPRAGEAFDVKWQVVGTDAPLSSRFVLCHRADALRDVACEGSPIGEFAINGTPEFRATASGAPNLLVLGIICAGGAPSLSLDGSTGTCEGSTGVRVSQDVVVGTENRNPSIDDEQVRLDGAPWRAATAGASGCDGLPSVRAGEEKHRIEIVVKESDREVVAGRRESVQISHLTTAGTLDRQFSVVENDRVAEDAPAAVEWKSPKEADLTGDPMVVWFYFALRDPWGGAGFGTRALCVRSGK